MGTDYCLSGSIPAAKAGFLRGTEASRLRVRN